MTFSTNSETYITQPEVIKEFRKELKDYYNQISNLDKNQKNELEKRFHSGLEGLWNNIENNTSFSDIEKQAFKIALQHLKDPNQELTDKDMIAIEGILSKYEKKDENGFIMSMEQLDLQKMHESIEQVKKTKQDLNNLQQTIVNGTLAQKEKEIKQKIETYKEKLKGFSKEHPIWTKALIMLLPANLAVLFKKKETSDATENTTGPSSEGMGQIKDVVNQIKGYFSFAMDWMAQIAVMFFSSQFFGAPKEMQELLSDIKKLGKVNPEILKKFGGGLSGVVEEVRENKEVSKDSISYVEAQIKKGLPATIKKISGKEVSEQELNEIMKEINVKEFFQKDTKEMEKLVKFFKDGEKNDANYLKAGFEGITFPFRLFARIVAVLRKRDLITISDLGVSFVKKSGDIILGSFGLLGSGIDLLKGHIDGKNFEQQVKDLLDTEPTVGKQILAVMLYRHGGLLFSTLGEISNYVGKSIIYTLSGETSLKNTIVSGLKGNVNEYIRVLKKFNAVVPADLKVNGLDILEKTINEFDEANNIVKLLLDSKNKGLNGTKFIEEYKKIYGKAPSILGDISGISADSLRSTISGKLTSLGQGLDRQIGIFSSYVGKNFKGITSSEYLLDNLSKHIKATSSYLSDVVKNDNIFNNIRSQIKKLGLTANMMEIDPLYDKLVFKFSSPQNAKEFFANLSKLAKQSPELVRFIFDKTPLFLVAGLSAAKGDTMEEFGKQLLFLVPFVGSGYMLMDAMYAQNTNLVQAGTAGILLGTETGYVIYQGFIKKDWGKIVRYIFKPGQDIIEIAGFISRSGFTIWKVSTDALKLIAKGKLNISEFKGLLKGFPKLKSKLGLVLLVLFGVYEFAFAGDNEIEQLIKNCKKDGKMDISCMDEKIKNEWKTLDNETKAEFIAFAYGLRTGKTEGVKGEFKDGKYIIHLNKDYGAFPNKTQKDGIISTIRNILKKYGENNLNIVIEFEPTLIDYVCSKNNLDTDKKKKKYFQALGYSDERVYKILHPYN